MFTRHKRVGRYKIEIKHNGKKSPAKNIHINPIGSSRTIIIVPNENWFSNLHKIPLKDLYVFRDFCHR